MKHIKEFESFQVNENKEPIGIEWQDDFDSNTKDIIEDEVHGHAADMIEQGYKEGELFGEEPEYKGWWKVSIQDDDNDEEIRNEEVAKLIRDGNTSGYNPTFTFSANIWSNDKERDYIKHGRSE